MANDYSGRQIVIDSTGTINIPCNIKVIDAWWQDAAAVGDTFSFTDAIGREFKVTAPQIGYPVAIGRLDWLAGPLTVTAISSGKAYLILGNK